MKRHRWEKKRLQVAREQQAAARAKRLHPAGKEQDSHPTLPPGAKVVGFDLDRYLAQFTSAPQWTFSGSYSTVLTPAAPLDLPVRQQAEPITAWKRARIGLCDGQPVLRGVMYGEYKPVDAAVHARSDWLALPARDHKAPHVDCICGFYGVTKDRLHEVSMYYGPNSCADLEVELYGTVIRHRDGWRAEKQRVLAVHLDLSCAVCRRPAQGVSGRGVVCRECFPGTVVFTPAELSSLWGVEVRWQAMP